MRRSHDRYNDVEPSSPPQSSPDYTIVIRGYNFREGQGLLGLCSCAWRAASSPPARIVSAILQ